MGTKVKTMLVVDVSNEVSFLCLIEMIFDVLVIKCGYNLMLLH